MFIERYVNSLNSSDLRDDEHHHATEALQASAIADQGSGKIDGSLLVRVKYASARKTFESGCGDMLALLKAWEAVVTARGEDRVWLPIKYAWDVPAKFSLYKKVAQASLAYWLNPNCEVCHGSKVDQHRRSCPHCQGTGLTTIISGGLELKYINEMIGELEGAFQMYQERAGRKMRRAA